MDLDRYIRKIPDFPKEGILFYDITTLFENAEAFRSAIDSIYDNFKDKGIGKVVGIDARGFLIAGVLAYKLGAGLSIVRKKGKLPYKTVSRDYTLEYASNTIEMHEDTVRQGEKILVADDLIATGGTMQAALELIEQMGGIIAGVACVIDLPFLGGSAKIRDNGHEVFSLLEYNSEKI